MRITNDIRDKIEKALIEHAFRERQNAVLGLPVEEANDDEKEQVAA